jgi:hypothetical protein
MSLEEAPAVADDAAERALADALSDARLATEAELLDGIEQRRLQCNLSLAELDRLSALTFGHSSKALSPARTKSPTARTLFRLLDSLALSIVLVVDGTKAARIASSWRPRREEMVRTRPLSPAVLARAKPHVVAALLRTAKHPKHRDTPAPVFLAALMNGDAP